jgi:hypothetical protein
MGSSVLSNLRAVIKDVKKQKSNLGKAERAIDQIKRFDNDIVNHFHKIFSCF